jgi:hypothetical protein
MATVAVENIFVFQWLRANGEIPLGSTILPPQKSGILKIKPREKRLLVSSRSIAPLRFWFECPLDL